MKDFLLFVPLTIVFLAFKSATMPTVPLPDLPLIITFYLAYKRPSLGAVFLCFVLGYVDDTLSGALTGVTSFSLVMVFMLVRLLARKVHFTSGPIKGMGCGVGVVVKSVLSLAILEAASSGEVTFATYTVATALMSAVFAPIIIALLERMASISFARTA